MLKKYQEILVASNNLGKIKEITALLQQINIKAVSPLPFNLAEPDETGQTFAQNSLLKAKYYAQKTKLPALADDSGLCILALQNQPGVHSARYAIDPQTGQKNFSYAFDKIFSDLTKLGFNDNKIAQAYFICDLCFYDPDTDFTKNFTGRVDGKISFKPIGDHGFGYDPIFIKEGMTQTFAELQPDFKHQISHRALAFEKFLNWLENL